MVVAVFHRIGRYVRRTHIGLVLFLLQETGPLLLRTTAIFIMGLWNSIYIFTTLVILWAIGVPLSGILSSKYEMIAIAFCGIGFSLWMHLRLKLTGRVIRRYSTSTARHMRFRCYILSFSFGAVVYLAITEPANDF